MLNSLRKSAGSWLAKILIGLLVLAFATWGINDVFTTQRAITVAEVGSEDISSYDFVRVYNGELQQISSQLRQRLTPEQIRLLQIRERAINRLVNTTTLNMHARSLGLNVSEETVTQEIFNDPSFRGVTGQFSQETFNRFLFNASLTERAYIEEQRDATIRRQLTASLVNGLPAPKTLVEARNLYENETRTLKFFNIPLSAIEAIKDPSETELEIYYDNNKSEFRAPEYRKISYFILSPDEIKKTITIEDDVVQQAYEDNIAQYTKQEQRDVQQISFPNLEKAQEAFKKLEAGETFEEVAKAYDQTLADINLGLKSREDILDSTIAEEIFKLEEGKFSRPIEGRLNTVIAKVTKINPEEISTFEDVKETLRDELAQQRANEDITSLQNSIEDERGTAELKDIASKFNLSFKEAVIDARGNGEDGQPISEIGTEQGFIQSVFESDVGNDNEAVVLNTANVIWFEVTDITLTRIKDFAEVKEQAKENWKQRQQRDALRKKAQELIDKLKAGEAMDAVAKSIGATIETSTPLKREDASEKLARQAIARAFITPLNEYGDVTAADGEARTIFQVTKIEQPQRPDAQVSEGLNSRLEPEIANDMLLQYVQGLQNKYGVSIDNAAIETALTTPVGGRGSGAGGPRGSN